MKRVFGLPVNSVAVMSLAVAALWLAGGRTALAQLGYQQQAVGGVSVNTDGVLKNVDPVSLKELRDLRQKALAQAPGDLNRPAKLRMVSLRGLQDTIAEYQKQKKPLPTEVRLLAGLERVEYVFADPLHHDVILAGPAEGWRIGADGEMVGATTGLPLLQLDDLLVAIRSADAARQGGVSCSIDPTQAGLKAYQEFMSHQKTIGNPDQTLSGIEQSLGPQTITVKGVPGDSRFAHVMVSADYRMKRLAMDFEPAPVKGLPSYLEMLPASGRVNGLPRWWLAASYQPLQKDPEGLAWHLRGTGVKCMTEEDFLNANGSREHSGKTSGVAQKWADLMSEKYEELATKDSVFGQLRNCMDLAVVASLIQAEQLAEKSDCHLDLLRDEKQLPIDAHQVPKQVDSKASFIKRGHNYLISASGGVQFQPWAALQKTEVAADTAGAREKALSGAKPGTWWWE